jgi:hypothetical protein
MPHDTTDLSTHPQITLADFCERWPEGQARPRYPPAGLVLVRPSGETPRFTCAEHAPTWASRVQGKYLVLERDEWEARGAGCRGRMLGG